MATEKKDRRKAADIWIYLLRSLAFGGWILFIIALVLSFYAAPETSYGLVRYYGQTIRGSWQYPFTGYLYLVLCINALTSFLCLLIANFRNRRLLDTQYFNAFLLLIISIAWVTYIILHQN